MKTRKNLEYTDLQNMTTAELKKEARKLENSIRRQYNRLKEFGYNPMFKPLNIKDIDKSTQARKKYMAAIKKGQETMGLETYSKKGMDELNNEFAKTLNLEYEKPTKNKKMRYKYQTKDKFGEMNVYIDKEDVDKLLDAWNLYRQTRDFSVVEESDRIYRNLIRYAIEDDWLGLSIDDIYFKIREKARELQFGTKKDIDIEFEDDMPY